MLLDAGAAQVVAVEPSAAFEVLRENTEARKDRVNYLNLRGDALPRTWNWTWPYRSVRTFEPGRWSKRCTGRWVGRPRVRLALWARNEMYLQFAQP
jgi:hypothetical protein